MNLKMLFNFNYFKENLRKSKGLLAFFLGIVPLLNVIMFIINGKSLNDFNDISAITCTGLYVVPIILAISLMGFIFNKKSTDFVMSKPLNRKTIYLTNIIGGILTLILMIFLNALIFGVVSLLFSDVIIPFSLLIDYFCYWSIAYIFVFTVTMLAITIAGNSIGSFILIFIIICFFPFFSFTKYVFSDYHSNTNYIKCTSDTCAPKEYFCYNEPECEKEIENNNYPLRLREELGNNFTAPLLFLNANKDTIYNIGSMLKMIILSIMYAVIGFITFKHRKMENNEISFYSEFMHFFVKTLVFIPVCFVLYAITISGVNGAFIIAIAGAIIFYLIYDLITRRSIFKLRTSLFICLVSFGMLIGTYTLYNSSFVDSHIYLDKIDSINFYHNGEYLKITEPDLINQIIKNTLSTNNYMNRETMFISNNKYYNGTIALSDDTINLINDYIYKRNIKMASTYKYNSIDYATSYIPVTKEFKSLVEETMHYVKLSDFKSALKSISVYDYQNHHYERLIVPYTLNKDLDKYVLTSLNNEFINHIENYKGREENLYFSINHNLFTDLDYFTFNFILHNNLDSFKKYLKENNNETKSENTCSLNYQSRVALEIGDCKKFYQEFKKYEERLKNTPEYQDIVKSYNEDLNNKTYEY